MEKLFISVITLWMKPLYDKNMAYYKLTKEFREKLPRPQHQAKVIDEKI